MMLCVSGNHKALFHNHCIFNKEVQTVSTELKMSTPKGAVVSFSHTHIQNANILEYLDIF